MTQINWGFVDFSKKDAKIQISGAKKSRKEGQK